MRSLCTALLVSVLSLCTHAIQNGPFSASSRWIVDKSGQRVKLRCVNWAGHQETNIPEGLQYQPIDKITAWIANNGFNCVRLTYSIDMALSPNELVSDTFQYAANVTTDGPEKVRDAYEKATINNPFLVHATTLETYQAVLQSLDQHNIYVVLDNHVSFATWCCGESDGNGWWDDASGYNPENSRFFNTTEWAAGLSEMALVAANHSNVVAMSLRNELRAADGQDGDNHVDWYDFVNTGATAIHNTNKDLLVVIGGVSYATDLSFMGHNPLDNSQWPGKTLWEMHAYAWSGLNNDDCDSFHDNFGKRGGYLLAQDEVYTGPLWVSEFGLAQIDSSPDEQNFLSCFISYIMSNDADWAIWALQGSYYMREGTADHDEGYGLLNHDWSDWRNGTMKDVLAPIMEMTQGMKL